MVISNHLINLYGKAKRYNDALEIQQQSEALLKSDGELEEPMWTPQTDFYFLSKMLFEKMKQKTAAEKYREFVRKKCAKV